MKTLKAFKMAALATAITVVSATALANGVPSSAADSSKTPAAHTQQIVPKNSFYLQQLRESHQLMTEVSMAKAALDTGDQAKASEHVQSAMSLAADMKQKSPELSVQSTLRFNNKEYTENQQFKDYLIPAQDDLFTLNDYNTKAMGKTDQVEAAETEAGMGRYTLALDVRNVQAALQASQDFIGKGELGDARVALDNIYQGAVENQVSYQSPLWAVEDNLVVARSLIHEKDYDGAKFALNQSVTTLDKIQSQGDFKGDPTLAKLHKEISAVQAKLDKAQPTMWEEAKGKVATWIQDLHGVSSSHAAKAASATIPPKQTMPEAQQSLSKPTDGNS